MNNCELCGEPIPAGEEMFRYHGYSGPCPKPPLPKDTQPRVTDNDNGEIIVSLDGRELRGWGYIGEDERRTKMLAAREYVEGWCDGRDARSPKESASE